MICKCSKPGDITYVNVTTDSGDGTKYIMNPIRFNSDICCNFEVFEQLDGGAII